MTRVLARYIDSIYRGAHAGARRPRTAHRAAPPRLRAEEAAVARRSARSGASRSARSIPALRRLERAGRDRGSSRGRTSRARSPHVPTGSLDGDLAAARLAAPRRCPARRTRKAYRITDRGRDRCSPSCSSPTTAATTSAVRPEARVLPLPRRRPAASAPRAPARRSSRTGSPSARRAPTPHASTATRGSLLEHRTQSTERDLAWIDELIAERARRSDPRPTDPEGATA